MITAGGAVHVPAVPGGGGVAHRARERMDGDPPVQVEGGVPAEALVPVILPGGVLRDLRNTTGATSCRPSSATAREPCQGEARGGARPGR